MSQKQESMHVIHRYRCNFMINILYICFRSDSFLPDCHLQDVCKPMCVPWILRMYTSSHLRCKPPAVVPGPPDLHCTLSVPLCLLQNVPAMHVHDSENHKLSMNFLIKSFCASRDLWRSKKIIKSRDGKLFYSF